MLARTPLSEFQRRAWRGYQQQWQTRHGKATVQKQNPTRKLNGQHRRRLIEGTADILRRGDPTAFAFEAFCRHGIRSGLCLKGWNWTDADAAATDIVSAALRQIGARRPTWQQGQPEYTQDGVIVNERTRCIRCGWRLPEGHRKFCGPVCFTAHHNALARRYRAEEVAALEADDAA